MKIKRYVITENNQINKINLEKYITENNISQNEIPKIQIEHPSEIIVFYNENEEMAGSLNLWHNRPNYNGKATSYIGNVNILEKYRKNETEIFNEIFENLKKDCIETIIGPLNGTTWNTYRYVTDMGNHPPFLLEPFNEEYYVELFEKIGFEPLAYYISTIMENMNPVQRGNLSKKIEKLRKFDFYKDITVKSAENEDLLVVLNKVYDLTIEAFKNNFLYSKLDREIFLKMYMSYEDKIVKKFFKMLYLKDELIGYVFGIPDYAELQYKEKIKTMILKTIAISPKYNGKGMGYILIDELVKEAERSGYKNVIYALMHEKNISKNIGSLLGDELRRYALFIKEL
ncbi:GNAT family N-acetyltransferase [Leptotrichia sp. oral taxon 223]|uniref:GNAT family N-acetyltransferase n=1 Tax=Leptotrichia sp. oral taxon 223 TaxID=712363 RepID=UPI0015BFE8F9|nr:GNAT family N-acetyltransferase [Leptotrichia sp. oral taxon 223]NWO18108.1 GNAT family N-acetyltransferase [Leptotrichia sp. oral taxon 223]